MIYRYRPVGLQNIYVILLVIIFLLTHLFLSMKNKDTLAGFFVITAIAFAVGWFVYGWFSTGEYDQRSENDKTEQSIDAGGIQIGGDPVIREMADMLDMLKKSDDVSPLSNLAKLLQYQGRYAEAEPLYRRALQIREKELGSEHPDVAESLNNLAVLLVDDGKYAEAQPLFRRALQIREKKLGPNHLKVAESLNDLAELRYLRDKYAEADSLCQRALQIRERELGPDHPEVAESLNNLAELRYILNYAEAEQLAVCRTFWDKNIQEGSC